MSLTLYVYWNGHSLQHFNHKWPDWWMDAHVNWKWLGVFHVSTIPTDLTSTRGEWINAPSSPANGDIDQWLGFGHTDYSETEGA